MLQKLGVSQSVRILGRGAAKKVPWKSLNVQAKGCSTASQTSRTTALEQDGTAKAEPSHILNEKGPAI